MKYFPLFKLYRKKKIEDRISNLSNIEEAN